MLFLTKVVCAAGSTCSTGVRIGDMSLISAGGDPTFAKLSVPVLIFSFSFTGFLFVRLK